MIINSDKKLLATFSTHELAQYLREERNTAFILWQMEDVIVKAKEIGYECNRQQAKDIIGLIQNNADCQNGITWYVLDEYICEYCKKKEDD